MESMVGAHYFSLPTQGNVYTVVTLPLANGKNKALVATLKRKVFSCEFSQNNTVVVPVIKEVLFTYIPSGAEIISINAFNRSQTYDDFFVGITIIKVLLTYVYENDSWILSNQYKFSHPIHSIIYVDLTDDGLKELLVVTMLGVNIFQHNLQDVLDKFKKRLFQFSLC